MLAKFELDHHFDDTAKNDEPQESEPRLSAHEGGCNQFAGANDRCRENKARSQMAKTCRKCLRGGEDATRTSRVGVLFGHLFKTLVFKF